MTRKDYERLAGAIREAWCIADVREFSYGDHLSIDETFTIVIDELNRVLRSDNPRFDENKFWKACKPWQ